MNKFISNIASFGGGFLKPKNEDVQYKRRKYFTIILGLFIILCVSWVFISPYFGYKP